MKQRLAVVLGLLAGAASLADPALGQTLEQALSAAYANNPQLLAERAKVRATDEEIPQALSNWRPTVEMTGDFASRATQNNAATNRRQHRDPRSLSFTLDQPVYRGGRTLAAVSEAKNTVQAARARLRVVEQAVLLDGATSFMNVLRDQAVLELNTSNEQVLERNLEATRDRFQVGEITRTDVHQAEARLARVRAERIQAESDLESSRAAYRNVIGEVPGSLVEPRPPTDLPASLTEAVKIAVIDDPNVIAGRFDEKALADNAQEVRGELLPEVNIEGTASRAFDTVGQESRVDTYEAKVTLTVPLYQSGSVYSRLREAKQSVAEQRLRTDQARRDATERAIRVWEDVQAAQARIEAFRTEIEANEIALEGVQREAAVGSRTVLDVLDAEQELLDAKVNHVRATRDALVAIFELKVALGQMTARRLDLPVEFYDPDVHYREVRNKLFGGTSSGEAGDVGGTGPDR